MELKKLRADIIEKIKSTFSINTVSQCVTELVLNSLDAKSTAIAVRLNLVSFKIQVVDNGEGILEENMSLLGCRYFTNKCKSLEDLEKYVNHYGFRGEAIASIVECSKTVNIISRHQNSNNTFSRTLEKLSVGEVSKTKSRPSVGSTVTVEGFFHILPVRKKRIIAELELEEIKRSIESLIILHPNVSFSVRNDVKCELILNSHKNQDMISSFKYLHPNLGDDFSLMKVSKNKLTIDALIYKSMSENKNLQYIYVNKRPIFSSKIQKLVRSLFKKNLKIDKKNPVAALSKYPVFVLNIKCPNSKVDILFNPTKTMVAFENWDIIHHCINKMIDSFFGMGSKCKKKENLLTEEELKRDCGVSQIGGAHRRFGYKRKHLEDENAMEDDIIKTQIKENEHKQVSNNNESDKNYTKDILKKHAQENNLKESQKFDGESFHISNVTSFHVDFRSNMKFKEPLPIQISRAQTTKNQMTSVKENMLLEKQDDLSISKFTNDQNKGKNLIMNMFLKSTQVYNSDESLDKCGSQETIYEEESNFKMENNYQTKFKGMSNTMSVSVNVKSKRKIKRKKKQQEILSKYVQTNIENKQIVSKAVQTSMQETHKKKKGRYILKGFKSSMHSKNYTVMLSDSGKKAHFKFVTNKTHEDDVEPNMEFNFPKKCNCECHGDDKLFNFGGQTNDCRNSLLNNNIYIPKTDLSLLFREQKGENLPKQNHPLNWFAQNRDYIENWVPDFEIKERVCHSQNYPDKSPYFVNKYLENNLACYQQHPDYPVKHYNAGPREPFVPHFTNLQHLELNRNFKSHNPTEHHLHPHYGFQNKGKHRDLFYIEDQAKNIPDDWTIVTSGLFKPVHMITQKDRKNYWRNSSSKLFEPFHFDTRRNWTINSFGQFKPSLFSTQKDKENESPVQKEIMFTPSSVQQFNPTLNILIDSLNHSQENREETVKNCAVNSVDHKMKGLELKIDDSSKPDEDSKCITLSKHQKTQDIVEAEKSFLAKEFLNWDSQFTHDIGNDWIKKINKCGNSYYINKKTGFTTFQTPRLVENQFTFGKRYDFMPKGMSPIMTETKKVDKSLSQRGKDILSEYTMETYKNELLYVKWQHYLSDVDPETFFKNIHKEKLKMFKGCIPDFNAVKKMKNMDNVISFSKDLFSNIEVIGQLDKKFIVVLEKKTNLLLLFDQHAVHERIRLEKLLKIYDGAKSKCAEKMVFFISQNDLSLLKNHKSYLDYLGLTVDFFGNGVTVSTMPLCLTSKFKETNFSDKFNKIMQMLIKEIIENLKSTRGVHLKSLPKLLQNVVNLEACRGAIKFGDALSKEKCERLLVQLSSCNLPFQCAHGRPTLVPLIILALDEKNVHYNLYKLK